MFWNYILLVMILAALGGFIAMLIYTYPISKRVYEAQLVRVTPDKWGRECSAPENEEQLQMWNDGIAWMEENREKIIPVDIYNDELHLFGEYFDFGCDRCAIIIPGRCESLMYSYYFAPPYQKAGFNVLVIDTRCHGKSDGKYNTIGVQERKDVLAWGKLLYERFGNREIYIHGICIGTASGIYALIDPQCPDYFRGLVTEGCFVSFRETFKRHMIADKRPLFPVLDLVMLQINRHTGTNVYLQNPIRAMKKLRPDLRFLFLYGKQDIFSIPEKSQKLFDACAVKDKKLVWFRQGGHSHLRINNTAQYDEAILEFFGR